MTSDECLSTNDYKTVDLHVHLCGLAVHKSQKSNSTALKKSARFKLQQPKLVTTHFGTCSKINYLKKNFISRKNFFRLVWDPLY